MTTQHEIKKSKLADLPLSREPHIAACSPHRVPAHVASGLWLILSCTLSRAGVV